MRILPGLIVFVLAVLLLGTPCLAAQTSAEGLVLPDSLSLATADSLQTATTPIDSLFYTAGRIYYDYQKNLIRLYDQPVVNYQDSEIQADSLYVDLDKERAYSFGPTRMRDADQLLLGSDVRYDVNTQTGLLVNGFSMVEKGYYGGKELRKTGSNIYDIDGGSFTNCDLEEPSFWFWSRQLRIYRSDKIVGKPVIGYVNHFPVFYFPFITVPIKRGRYPGFLIPSPDYNNIDGISIRDIAYYYPYKDYADFTLGFDLMEKTGWKAKFDSEYIKRYAFKGNLNASFQHGIGSTGVNNDWAIQGRHHQDLPERASLDANLNFISNKRIWQSSGDL
nr:putative LPS assembly protein LptD [Candidatus Cloacimonas sp.]